MLQITVVEPYRFGGRGGRETGTGWVGGRARCRAVWTVVTATNQEER